MTLQVGNCCDFSQVNPSNLQSFAYDRKQASLAVVEAGDYVERPAGNDSVSTFLELIEDPTYQSTLKGMGMTGVTLGYTTDSQLTNN